MKLIPHRTDRGIALVIVMIVIVSLCLVAGGFVFSMKVETRLARNSQSDPELKWLGLSGVELAKYVVAETLNDVNQPYDALNQYWAGGTSVTNMAFADLPLDDFQLGRGTISVQIVDLERKFNINLADDLVLQQALALAGADASRAGTVVASIQDWIDLDDDPHIGGTESDFYQGLNPPYNAKNGPFDHVSELLLVNGVTPELYWGGVMSDLRRASVPTPLHLRDPANPTGELTIGLVELFRTLGNPQINANTASAEVLQLVPGMDEASARAIVSYRAGPDGISGNEDDTPFQSAQEIVAGVPGIDPAIQEQIAAYCATRSSTFGVEVTARLGEFSKTYFAVIRRNSVQDVVTLSFHWD